MAAKRGRTLTSFGFGLFWTISGASPAIVTPEPTGDPLIRPPRRPRRGEPIVAVAETGALVFSGGIAWAVVVEAVVPVEVAGLRIQGRDSGVLAGAASPRAEAARLGALGGVARGVADYPGEDEEAICWGLDDEALSGLE